MVQAGLQHAWEGLWRAAGRGLPSIPDSASARKHSMLRPQRSPQSSWFPSPSLPTLCTQSYRAFLSLQPILLPAFCPVNRWQPRPPESSWLARNQPLTYSDTSPTKPGLPLAHRRIRSPSDLRPSLTCGVRAPVFPALCCTWDSGAFRHATGASTSSQLNWLAPATILPPIPSLHIHSAPWTSSGPLTRQKRRPRPASVTRPTTWPLPSKPRETPAYRRRSSKSRMRHRQRPRDRAPCPSNRPVEPPAAARTTMTATAT
jgi:hypothetical protein